MPRPSATNRQAQQGTTAVTLAAETVVCTLAGISTDRADAVVNLEAEAQITYGVGTTACTLRVRRGVDATGVLVGIAVAEGAVAGATDDLEVTVQDQPGEVAGQSYVLTAQQTGATGNGSSLQASLAANF